jgi:hypothetical protein
MKLRALALLWALSLCGAALAQTPPPGLPSIDQVDQFEILRRGDLVTEAGEGPRSAAELLFAGGLAPPADDSDQFYVTVFGKSQHAPTAELVKAFEQDPYLACFVATPPGEGKRPWAHFNVYFADDASQAFRFKAFGIDPAGPLPVVVFQPPRDGSMGGIVETTGEGGKKVQRQVVIDRIPAGELGTPEQLGARITASYWLWCKKLEESGFVPPAKLAKKLHLDEMPQLAKSDSHGQAPPFPVPPRAQQFHPQFPTGGPAATPAANPTWGAGWLPSAQTLAMWLLVASNVFMAYREFRQKSGQPILVPDAVVQPLLALVGFLTGKPQATPATPPTPPALPPLPAGFAWKLVNGQLTIAPASGDV